ncbi:hypothetical protein BDQ12DRAFT_711759 [Crucibulum laeve]|uniref:Uncharacterized protein n=1 Tax=Crucibulum laeve TaxID=68775 RepID=A0A5C3M4S8_9AGAR|nr:hypothetical protein BDQ12DRAFT_711759 [Crucibulum laeve]
MACLQLNSSSGHDSMLGTFKTPDVVVRRKRKRRAVDPCLGFYLLLDNRASNFPKHDVNTPHESQDHRQLSLNQTVADTSVANRCSTSANVSETLLRTSADAEARSALGDTYNKLDVNTPILTIETFLPLAKPLKRYGRKYNKNTVLEKLMSAAIPNRDTDACIHEDSEETLNLRSRKVRRISPSSTDCSPEGEASLASSSPTNRISRLRQGTAKRKHKHKKLGERLYEAAIVSNGDPLDNLVQPNTNASRQPLQFAPVETPLYSARHVTLRDPRTTNPFRSASSVHTPRAVGCTPSTFQSLTRWRTDYRLGADYTTRPKVTRRGHIVKKYNPKHYCSRSSLDFVPIQEAEEAYGLILRLKRPTSNVKDRIGPVIANDSPLVSKNIYVPHLSFVDFPQKPISSAKTVGEASRSSQPQLLNNVFTAKSTSLPNSVVYNGSLQHSVTNNPVAPAEPSNCKPTSCNDINDITLSRTTCTNTSLSSTARRQSSSPAYTIIRTNTSKKPLKPLASFLDGFLETVRGVAQAEGVLEVKGIQSIHRSSRQNQKVPANPIKSPIQTSIVPEQFTP